MKFFINLDSNVKDKFDMSKFLEFTDNYDPLTSSIMSDIQSLTLGGQYTIQGEDGRPDLVSYRIYGNSQYWWIILLYNQLLDYENIKTGDLINYPSLGSLETFYFNLKAQQLKSS